MRASSLLSVLAAAAAAYADCSSLGTGASNSVSGTFTLAAFNPATSATTSLYVDNAVTVPYTTYHVLSTSSGPSFGWLGLTMSGGVITTISPSQYTAPAYTVGNLAPNDDYPSNPPGVWPTFANTGAQFSGFCVVPNPSGGHATLALNGHTNLFSLCLSYISQTLPDTTAVLFNASSTAYGDGYDTYNGASCVPVQLVIVPSSS